MDTLPNILKRRWKAAIVGLTIGGLAIPYAAESLKSHSPEEAEALDQIHKLSYVFKERTATQCASTTPGNLFVGFKSMDGAERTFNTIKKLYDTPQEQAETLQFLADNNVRLHASSSRIDSIYAVFYNDTKKNEKTLIVQSGAWDFANFNTQMKDLIERMKIGDLLAHDGKTVIFNNEYARIPFKDIITLPDLTATSFAALPEAPKNTPVDIFDYTWKNPCSDAPAMGK